MLLVLPLVPLLPLSKRFWKNGVSPSKMLGPRNPLKSVEINIYI